MPERVVSFARSRPTYTLGALLVASLAVELGVFTARYPLLRYYRVPLLNFAYVHPVGGTALTVTGWIALFALYYAAYRLAPTDSSTRTTLLIAAGAVALSAGLLLTYPMASLDVYDYVARGHMVVADHANAFASVPADYPRDAFTHYVYTQNGPNYYGVVWTLQADGVSWLTRDNLLAGLIAYKLLALTYFWAGMPVVPAILRRLAPHHALKGLLLYAWSPLLQFEFAFSGHNDALVVFSMLLALLFLLQARHAPAVLALIGGALVKFVPVLVAPLAAVFIWRDPRSTPRRKATNLAAALAIGAGATLLMYLPYGLPAIVDTFHILGQRAALFGNSPAALAVWVLTTRLGVDEITALTWVGIATKLIVVDALVVLAMRLLRRPYTTREDLYDALVGSAYQLFFVFLAVGVVFLWPWYLAWLFAFAPLINRRGYAAHATAFSALSFAIYFMSYFIGIRTTVKPDEQTLFTLVLVALMFVPLAVLTALTARTTRTENKGANRLDSPAPARA